MNESPSSSLSGKRICFYGAGSMAEAILRGILDAQLVQADRVTMINRSNTERLHELTTRYGVMAAHDEASRQDALQSADMIVLGMKPKDAAVAIQAMAPLLRSSQLILSVIAGLSIDTMEALLGGSFSIARTMPNTSSAIGIGATGISFSASAPDKHRTWAETIFRAIGMTAVVEESLIDAVTAVSGSGPAYVYALMEAMIAAGQQLGLSPESATELTVQTVRGAAEMVRQTGEQPAQLRCKVTSPGGTTEAALRTLEQYRFQDGMQEAMRTCAERAREMGAQIRQQALERQPIDPDTTATNQKQ